MIKSAILILAGILSLSGGAVRAQDCADFSGVYELVPSTQQSYFCDGDHAHTPADCFSFGTNTFEISQKGCESVVLHVPGWADNTPMSFSADGREVSEAHASFFRDVTTSIRVDDQNPQIVDLEYQMRTSFFGAWAYPYRYTAKFKRR